MCRYYVPALCAGRSSLHFNGLLLPYVPMLCASVVPVRLTGSLRNALVLLQGIRGFLRTTLWNPYVPVGVALRAGRVV